MMLHAALALSVIAWLFPSVGYAETDVLGVLYRQNQASTSSPVPLSGYDVYLYSKGTGWIGPSVTDSYGRFALYKIAPGDYLLRIYTSGCEAWQQEIKAPSRVEPIVLPGDISADNTSRYVGNQWWEWTVFIKASPEVLKQVKCVEYTLHKTFREPIRTACRLGHSATPFGHTTAGWGTFEIPIKVTFKDGTFRCLRHRLTLEAPREG